MAFDRLESEAFWRDLAPGLTVVPEARQPDPVLSPNDATAARILTIYGREGYIQLPRSQDAEQMTALAGLVESVLAAGLPPAFAFIYDEMWRPYRRLGPILDCLLGGPHGMMPNLWAWHVDPKKIEAGWAPHRDRPGSDIPIDARPRALTVWIPFTRATALNGCMYVVPKHRDVRYGKSSAGGLSCDVADIRAVPAEPGDSLIWTHDLLHWGSRTSELSTAPRMSMSVEFQLMDAPAVSNFIIQPEQLLTFGQKLALIGRAIAKYSHMHKMDGELTEVAKKWADRLPAAFGLSV
jgi:Phytanoyl-CoA dioxygenase (PhyH)